MTLGWLFYGHHDIIKTAQAGVKSAPLRWLCGIQEIMRIFSRPLTEKRRLPRKPTYQASKQAASQGRCVLMALPQQGTEISDLPTLSEASLVC